MRTAAGISTGRPSTSTGSPRHGSRWRHFCALSSASDTMSCFVSFPIRISRASTRASCARPGRDRRKKKCSASPPPCGRPSRRRSSKKSAIERPWRTAPAGRCSSCASTGRGRSRISIRPGHQARARLKLSGPSLMVIHMGRWARVGLFFVVLGMAACGDEEKTKAKIAEIQKQADEKIAQAEKSANEKLAALQQQMEATKAQLVDAAAQAKAEADDAISKAQSNADEAAKSAAAALTRARQAYKDEGHQQLNALNKEISDINAKIAKATATVK